jgi:hypothetical protein
LNIIVIFSSIRSLELENPSHTTFVTQLQHNLRFFLHSRSRTPFILYTKWMDFFHLSLLFTHSKAHLGRFWGWRKKLLLLLLRNLWEAICSVCVSDFIRMCSFSRKKIGEKKSV